MTAVITGVGVVSAFGDGARALFDGLSAGRSGIRRISNFDASSFPTHVAGEVPVSSVPPWFLAQRIENEPLATRLGEMDALRDRKISWGLMAAWEAWRDAACGDSERGATLVLALGLEQALLEDFGGLYSNGRIAWERGAKSGVRYRSPVDLTSRAVRELLGLRGPAIVNASACAAGALAVAHAASLIERGAADIVVCGAADSMVNPLGLGGMCRLGAPSPRDELDACRPFDRDRDGLVIGEGAAMFVVEHEDRVRGRVEDPYARIVGWGSTQDGYRATAPRPDGAAARRAMEKAIARAERAGVPASTIGYINAHGTGTPLNDPAECKAIHGALGDHANRVAVSSIKGAVGHLMAASGAIEIAASLLAFQRDVLPGTANHKNLDPECNVDVIGETPRDARVDALLTSSFGFGGQNASIVLARPR